MGTFDAIRQKLLSGSTTSQLIGEGYAKSSVNHVVKKLKKAEPTSTPSSPVDDELKELRHQKEVVKLRKEISELEDSKEKIPDRLGKLEAEVLRLNKDIPDLVGNCCASIYAVILRDSGSNEVVARQEAIRITNEILNHYGY